MLLSWFLYQFSPRLNIMYLLSMDFCRGFVSFLRMNTVCDHLGIKAVSLQKSKVKQCEDTSECIKKTFMRMSVYVSTCHSQQTSYD